MQVKRDQRYANRLHEPFHRVTCPCIAITASVSVPGNVVTLAFTISVCAIGILEACSTTCTHHVYLALPILQREVQYVCSMDLTVAVGDDNVLKKCLYKSPASMQADCTAMFTTFASSLPTPHMISLQSSTG
jgi:hypothetical protein